MTRRVTYEEAYDSISHGDGSLFREYKAQNPELFAEEEESEGGTTGENPALVPVVQMQDDVETRISEAELEQLGQVAFPFCYIEAA